MDYTIILVVVIALVFDFTNGFHDTANSIATLVGTRAMRPQLAVFMAASLNFVGAFWSIKVAQTIGKDVVDPSIINTNVVLAGLTGAIVWEATLPFAGNATPSTYAINGRQFIVIACGGGKNGAPSGSALVAFALPPKIAKTVR